jgi:recombinational DNA repair protein RecR
VGKILQLRPGLEGSIANVTSWLYNKIDEHYSEMGNTLATIDDYFCQECNEFLEDDGCSYCVRENQ